MEGTSYLFQKLFYERNKQLHIEQNIIQWTKEIVFKKIRKCIPGIQVTFFVPLQQLLCFCFLCVGKIIYPTIKLNWKRNRNYRRIPGEKHRYNGIENVNKCKIEVNALK